MVNGKANSEPVNQYVYDVVPMEHVPVDFIVVLKKLIHFQFGLHDIFGRKQKFQAFLAVGAFVTFDIGCILATTSNLMRTFSFEIYDNGALSPLLVILVHLMLTIGFITIGSTLRKSTEYS